jgi:glycosyltransferase involved in cell wall biosynthesis
MVKVFKNVQLLNHPNPSAIPIAISIAFYNNLQNFDLMMAALEIQTQKEFLILICDDGSKPEVVDQVQKTLAQIKQPAMHVWHEDLGFRKNRLLNWGIHHCPAEYMVFVDQDCLPHPQFIEDHLEQRQLGAVLCGRRMELTPWQSNLLTPMAVKERFLQKNFWFLAISGIYMKDSNALKGLRIGNPSLRQVFNKKPRSIVGCNFSIYKKDLEAINGFDHRYEAPGTGEDSDIEFRLVKNGIKLVPMVHSGIQYHVFHKLTTKLNPNEEIFAEVQKVGDVVTKFGIRQQLAEKIECL